ncbi:hypothetical protein C0993_004844 [Termitomyces sp. T159_Od127]|nr:hypothetical protein C0993_004844 [Termitomyces sp. T159_Od127]
MENAEAEANPSTETPQPVTPQDQLNFPANSAPPGVVDDEEGWQTVTPKKNKKKGKKSKNTLTDSNKRPHSDSPLKERKAKRVATSNRGNCEATPCPSPTLSISALGYEDDAPQPEGSPDQETFPQERTQTTGTKPEDGVHESQPHEETTPTARSETPPSRRYDTPPPRQPPPKETAPEEEDTQEAEPQYGPTPSGMRERAGTPMNTSTPGPGEDYDTRETAETGNNNPELWYETTVNDITTNGKGLRRTATPEGGWPKVYLAAHPTYNIAARTLKEWQALRGPTLWARIYRARFEPTEAGKTKTEDAIKEVIRKLVYIEHDEGVAVIFPEQNLPAESSNRFPHPYHLLVAGLDQAQANRLLDLEVVATEETTIFFVPRNPPTHRYIMTIGGLKYNDTENAKEMVENLVRNALGTSPEIRAIIETKSRHTPEEAVDRALDIRASFLPIKQRDGVSRCWNIYFAGEPGFNEDDHKLLLRKMRACAFNTIGFGKGYALISDQPLCTGCKSADHDPYNCPFSKLPGWLGFKPGGRENRAGETDFTDDDRAKAHPGNREGARGKTRGRGGNLPQRSRGTGQMSRGRGRV